jgi:hypothetical protein
MLAYKRRVSFQHTHRVKVQFISYNLCGFSRVRVEFLLVVVEKWRHSHMTCDWGEWWKEQVELFSMRWMMVKLKSRTWKMSSQGNNNNKFPGFGNGFPTIVFRHFTVDFRWS